ncbi:MAG: type transport system ATP-binding protein [Kosmotogales bacterium]|nr:type transport system ATP-binding protein [Kosmotogales bacterium]
MDVLKVEKINKTYENFKLSDVSFNLEKGYIMGFIGANGAGKTTTLKSILNMIHIESGAVDIFGKDIRKEEMKIKSDIGYMFGGVDFYPKKNVSTLTDVVKRFYSGWNNETYHKYMKRFKIDENKKICELSNGMKVKYNLTLALSHDAKLFIFDEPTSGLDPVARDNILEIFQELIEDGEKSILFSTHIISDLDKCADFITYINEGKIVASSEKDEFKNSYKIVKGSKKQLEELKNMLVSYKENSFGFTGLIKTNEIEPGLDVNISDANLEDIMVYYARKGELN